MMSHSEIVYEVKEQTQEEFDVFNPQQKFIIKIVQEH